MLTDQIWSNLHKTLKEFRSQQGHHQWMNFAELAFWMKVLMADQLEFNEQGLNICLPKRTFGFGLEIPKLPIESILKLASVGEM